MMGQVLCLAGLLDEGPSLGITHDFTHEECEAGPGASILDLGAVIRREQYVTCGDAP